MTVQHWLQSATARLSKSGIGTARLDCLVLLEDATGKSRAHILAHPEMDLTDKEQNVLERALSQRSKHIPLSYIRGKTEFYGREFIVNNYVLEPRPESETMIDLLKDFTSVNNEHTGQVIDVGTGSGALAITAKLEHPNVKVIGIDIDDHCIDVASKNAKLHNVDINFVRGNLLDSLPTLIPLTDGTIIIANLPYVPKSYRINESAAYEPRHAIFGGSDGLDLYRQMFAQITLFDAAPLAILTESLPFQHKVLRDIAQIHHFNLIKEVDFIQVFGSQPEPNN